MAELSAALTKQPSHAGYQRQGRRADGHDCMRRAAPGVHGMIPATLFVILTFVPACGVVRRTSNVRLWLGRLGPVAVCLILNFQPALASAQQTPACGGHRVRIIGGMPRASVDRGTQSFHTTPPTIPEPDGMTARDRELWEALVFDTYDNFRWGSIALSDRGTELIPQRTVPTIRICIQSSDDSYTGERLAKYAVPSWWRTQIRRWTNLTWNNSIQIGTLRRGGAGRLDLCSGR